MAEPSRFVLGTAGHIDHGKTSLVRALTGTDLDQLPEEKERGITIALGFTSLGLDADRSLAIIDVPGHERLIRTMIAGATGMDGVMLCVSAVDGVMPQTREHLAILNLLGVDRGLIVITMMDLVDPEMLELAMEDARDATRDTFLQGSPVIPVSSVTGEGLEVLRQTLTELPEPEREDAGPFRLPVDRVFVQSGFGTVVTGTTISGSLKDGSPVFLLPSNKSARVRGIQRHGQATKDITSGQRAALNLSGVTHDEVERGMVITDRELPYPSMIDGIYQHLPEVGKLEDGAPIRVLCGTAERIGKLHLATDEEALEGDMKRPVQIRLDAPLPCLPGDRFIVRRTSPLQTLGGGVVVDCWASKMKKRDRKLWGTQIERLQKGETLVWVDRAGDHGLTEADWKARATDPAGVRMGERWYSPSTLDELGRVLLHNLDHYHKSHPLSAGARRGELQRGRLLGVDERTIDALLTHHAAKGDLQTVGALTQRAGFQAKLTPEQTLFTAALHKAIQAPKLEGTTNEVLSKNNANEHLTALLHHLEAELKIVQVPSVGWVDRQHMLNLKELLRVWFKDHEALSTAEFKDLSHLTRKTAIPWLEWLDKNRWTRREGNVRQRGSLLDD